MRRPRTQVAAHDGFLRRFAELAVLSGVAVAQPLYDLLARTPEFLAVHGAGLRETLILVTGLSFLLPLLWAALIQLLGLRAASLGPSLHNGSIYLLASLFFLQVADSGGRTEPGRVVLAALLLTLGSVLLDRKTRLVRSFLLILTPAILIFPGILLTRSGVRAVLMPPPLEDVAGAPIQGETPVVFVVFDGLPLTSLLESERQIDPVRYPAFERLARSATWYPRATTVADNTLEALPAMLSGHLPEAPLPTAAYYPRNLFTLLASSQSMVVDEPLTDLCPNDLCPEPGLTFAQRMGPLMTDVAVIYLHLVVPERLGHQLPQIQTSWRGFLALGRDQVDREKRFREFIDRVERAGGSSLYFIHSELPHAPHAYLPSGERYTASDNEPSGEGRQFAWWSDDVWAVRHSYQRHLLQVGFADRLLGDLLDALDNAGLFDAALMIVTSDHGVSFQPGRSRRMLEADNAHDVLSIPLLVKLPEQREPGIDERRVQIIDLLPTIAALFGIDGSHRMDGHSLLDTDWPGRDDATIGADRIDDDALEDQGRDSLERKLSLFGTGSTEGLFVRTEPFPGLAGLETAAWTTRPLSALKVDAALERATGLWPIQVRGTVTRPENPDRPVCLAVAGDGIVQTTTCAYRGRAGSTTAPWSVLLEQPLADPDSLEVFVIEGKPGATHVERTARAVSRSAP